MAIHPWSSVQNFNNWWKSGSGKTNALINSINKQGDIDKIYLYAKNLNEPKYEYLIKNDEKAGIKHLNDPNAFIECSNTTHDVFKKINAYNPNRKKFLIVFDDKIADIISNKIKELSSHN